ncbi:transcription factor VIP1-like [Vicia villosa]|uniref:transcription factor VIP1-like n=1 Tax=Vicia villosa TaxID=3911 RepID=UPI00273B7F24|nr:transcription factor VIP1-like [Vicia villosa]
MDMLSFIGATPATADNHHRPTSNCTNPLDFDPALENMLNMDLSQFDFSLFDIPLPPSSLPPIDRIPAPAPAPAQTQLLPNFSEVLSDNVNLIGRNSALTAGGGNGGGGGSVLGHRRDSNRFGLGSGSSAPFSYKKRTVIPPEKLAELEIADPRKAQRIISNRVAAKKSKERKRNYEKELEKRVELLQIRADNVTAERVMAMNEVTQLAAERKRIKDLIESTLQHQQKQRAVIELMKQEANMLKRQIHDMNTAMADLSFGEPVSQSQQPQVPHQPELYIPQQPPLVPPPPSIFGEPLLPPPPFSLGEPLLPTPSSTFGEPLVPPPPSLFGEPFIGTSFSNYNLWN